jgi:hypothetical protein
VYQYFLCAGIIDDELSELAKFSDINSAVNITVVQMPIRDSMNIKTKKTYINLINFMFI